MIPIASSTTLTIEKAAKLLQNLVDWDHNSNVGLPMEISNSVNRFLRAQQRFAKDIDDYMHNVRHFSSEDSIEMVTEIVETCPEFLATQDEDSWLPCHIVANKATSSAHKYLLLFARIGHQYEIGGERKRGSLLVETDGDYNALHYISDPNVFDVLKSYEPPLFHVKDIQNHYLLHDAAKYDNNLKLVKYFCNLDPSSLFQTNLSNELPIHKAVMRKGSMYEKQKIIHYLIQQSVLYSGSDEAVGGLFTMLPDRNTLVLNAMVQEWGREEAWDIIERALSTNKNLNKLPILHQTIRHAPQYIIEVINRFPDSGSVRDINNKNRLPIHVALEIGMKPSIELSYLMKVNQESFKEFDPVTKFPPFALAGMTGPKSCDLITIYRLLHECPEQIESWCNCESHKKRKLND